MELLPGIHRIDGVNCTVYLVVEPEGLTLIDTGLPGNSGAKVLRYIANLGHAPDTLRRIILTHQHVDHIGNLAALAHWSGAEVLAHPKDTPAIEGWGKREMPNSLPMRMAFRVMILPRLKPSPVTRQVRGDEVIPTLSGDGGLRVVETPGHTMGHISLYLPGKRLLFAGDAYRHSDGRVVSPPPLFNADTPLALRSMAQLAELDIETSLPGHGEPILTGAGTKLREEVAKAQAATQA